MAKLKKQEIENIRSSIEHSGEFCLVISHGRTGAVKARMWHADGHVVGSCGGYGYSKTGTVIGQAIELLFAPEIDALPLPNHRENGTYVDGGPSGLREWIDEKGAKRRYVEGGSGERNMCEFLKHLGFNDVTLFNTGKNSEMLLARKMQKAEGEK